MADDLSAIGPTPGAEGSRDSAARVRNLLKVLEVTRSLARAVDHQSLLELIRDAACQVLDCEAASIFLHDSKTNELVSRVSTAAGEIRFSADRGIAGDAFRSGKVINIPDAYTDPRFNPDVDRATGFITRSLLACPLLKHDDGVLGVFQVLNRRGSPFDADDEILARTFGAQAGVALERQLLLEEFVEKQRLQRELQIARKIQLGVLPRRPPTVEGYEIAGWVCPAEETGGDFYDLTNSPDGRLAVVLADVTGHGLGPALIVAECRALTRACLAQFESLGRLVSQVNRLLCDDLPRGKMVTGFFGLLRGDEGQLEYISAGQGPLLLYRREIDDVVELPYQGVPLGFSPKTVYDAPHDAKLAPGDFIVLITDGFIEWPDRSGRRFGLDNVRSLLRRERDAPAAEIIRRLHQGVVEFAGGTRQDDDLTCVVIKRL